MLDDFRDEDELNKNGEFLDEFRQRLNSQPIESFEERKNDINRSQHIFLGTVLGIGLAGVVSWFILSPDYSKVEDAEIPVVRKPQTAVKVQPADPGGMEILNQDKTVYDIVEKKDTSEVKVENLLPPPEEPKFPTMPEQPEPPAKIVAADSSVIADAEKIIQSAEPQPAQEAPAPQPAPAQPEPKAEIKVVVKDLSAQPAATTPPAPPVDKAETAKTTVAEPPAPAKSVVAEVKTPPLATEGSWQIQLISSPNRAAMPKAWEDLSKKYPSLKDLPHEIQEADLGAKGVFYRLMAGSFAERREADKICNAIKTAGGSCLVKKK